MSGWNVFQGRGENGQPGHWYATRKTWTHRQFVAETLTAPDELTLHRKIAEQEDRDAKRNLP